MRLDDFADGGPPSIPDPVTWKQRFLAALLGAMLGACLGVSVGLTVAREEFFILLVVGILTGLGALAGLIWGGRGIRLLQSYLAGHPLD